MKSLADKEVFKLRAYVKAINNIKALGKPIMTVEDVAGVPGIGAKIKDKITTIIETGHLAQTNSINTGFHNSLAELMRVHGIGPAKAKELVTDHGIKSIEDLQTRGAELLTHAQSVGLKYLVDFEKRIPRKEMERHESYFADVLGGHEFQIVGSYRRGRESSGDIDVLIRSSDAKLIDTISTRMKKDRYIIETMAQGDFKFMGVSRVKWGRTNRRLDMLVTPPHEYPFALLYFTGDAEFNKKMRAWVLSERSMSLSEHGLKDLKTKEYVETGCKTEEEIFGYLRLQYIAPSNRSAQAPLIVI
jgi:DNA polymerase beta